MPVATENTHDRATLLKSRLKWLHVLRLVVQTMNEDHFRRRHTLSHTAFAPSDSRSANET